MSSGGGGKRAVLTAQKRHPRVQVSPGEMQHRLKYFVCHILFEGLTWYQLSDALHSCQLAEACKAVLPLSVSLFARFQA